MRLTELKPQFFKYDIRIEKYRVVDGEWIEDKKDYLLNCGKWWKDLNDSEREANLGTKEVEGPREYLVHVDSLADSDGIMFLCPKCFAENHGPIGTHHVQMPFANLRVTGKHQWNASGSNYDDLTTTPSYLIIGGCNWHGYITNGDVSIL